MWDLARAQHGVVAWFQLSGAGMTARRVDGLVRRGEVQRLYEGVYLFGPRGSPHTTRMAAVLACGPSAWLSHDSATVLYGLIRPPTRRAPVHVTITGPHRGRHPGIRLHRTEFLGPGEPRLREGVPVTSPERTLIDFAASRPFQVETAVSEAFAVGLTDHRRLFRALATTPGRRGVGRLRLLLETPRGPARTRSGHERRLLRMIRDAGLPEPEINTKIGPWEVDLLWRSHGVVIEVDDYATHSSPRAFERDRRKSAELEDRGLTVRRITPEQLANPELTVARIRRTLHNALAE